MITIDGTLGEGGGQVLRSSLALRQAEIATAVLRIFTAHTQSDSCNGLDAQASAGLRER